jgi:Protein of unknown function (DUF3575)
MTLALVLVAGEFQDLDTEVEPMRASVDALAEPTTTSETTAAKAPEAPRYSLELDLGPLIDSQITVLFEFRVMNAMSFYLAPQFLFLTSARPWRAWTGAGLEMGLRLFPVSREAPRGWYFSLGLAPLVLNLEAYAGNSVVELKGTYGVVVSAALRTGYRWVVWRHLSINPSIGVRRILADVFPATPPDSSGAYQRVSWSLVLGLNLGAAF